MMRRLLFSIVFAVYVTACNPTIVAGSEAPLTSVTAASRQCGGAPAYQRLRDSSGQSCVSWISHQLVWRLGPVLPSRISEDKFRSAVQAAFQSWRDATSSCSDLTFAEGPRGDGMVANDGAFQVITRTTACKDVVPQNDSCLEDLNCGNRYNCWDHDEHALAMTTAFYSKTSGVILDTDAELNEVNWVFTAVDGPPCEEGKVTSNCVATDLQATVTHEIGHALGLAHSDSNGVFSTMSPSAEQGDTSMRTIDASSACYVCDVYPAGLPSRACQK